MELCLRLVGLSLFSSTRESTLDSVFSVAAAMVGLQVVKVLLRAELKNGFNG